MTKFLRTHILAATSFTALVLYLTVHFGFGSEPARRVANALLIGTGVTIVILWRRAAFLSWKDGARRGVEKIVLTIWMAWVVILAQRIYAAGVTLLNRPTWLLELPIGGLVIAAFIVVGVYAVIAPLYTDNPDDVLHVQSDVMRAGIMGAVTAFVVLVIYFVTGASF